MKRQRAGVLRWTVAAAGAVVLGLVAARLGLLASPLAVIGLGIAVGAMIWAGLRATMQPWDEWEE